jgi:hypothetical protein
VENLSPTVIRFLDDPAHSKWRYQLCYPGPHLVLGAVPKHVKPFNFGLYHFHMSLSSTVCETGLPEDMLIPHRLAKESNSAGKHCYVQFMSRHPQLSL